MNQSGPLLQTLLHRLAETPADFLAGPAAEGMASAKNAAPRLPALSAALVNDLLSGLGQALDAKALQRFLPETGAAGENRLALVRVIVWLLADPCFRSVPLAPEPVLRLLDQTAAELAGEAKVGKYLNDPDRREELVRLVLARLDFRPQGESLAQASDRLSAISSSERRRLVEASRETERRARAIREALVRKQAEESADKWTRE